MYNVKINGWAECKYVDGIYKARDNWALYYQVSIVGIKENSIHELLTIRAYYPHNGSFSTCLVMVWINGDYGRLGASKKHGYDAMYRSAVKAFSDAGIELDGYDGGSGISELANMGLSTVAKLFPDYSAIRAIYANN